MKPPYVITNRIIELISIISEKVGLIKSTHLIRPETHLRKNNQIKTIQASLEIEGNTLSEDQITALLNGSRVLAPAKDILEVENAIELYSNLKNYKFTSITDFKNAHKILMRKLLKSPGSYRTKRVGIVKGSKVQHLAPPAHLVNQLMVDLFSYLKSSNDSYYIKSCVFHYELEFIHPFSDGNGRMGRLWQSLILIQQNPLFEFVPVEHIVRDRQTKYYKALSLSDKQGNSTPFIEFMLEAINDSLELVINEHRPSLSTNDRLEIFREHIESTVFSRKQYLLYFKEISTATASRDLKFGIQNNILTKEGEKRMTVYRFNK